MTFCQANFTLTMSDLCAVLFHFSLLDYCILLCELLNSSCISTQAWLKRSPGSTWALGDKYRQAQIDRAYPPLPVNSGPSVRVAVWLCFMKTVFDQGWVSPIMPAKFCCSGNMYYCYMKTSVRYMGTQMWFGWNMAMEWKKASLTVLKKNDRWGVWFISKVQDLAEFKNN